MKKIEKFANSIIFITGATGFVGYAFLKYCLETNCKEIRILCRTKQQIEEIKYKTNYNKKITYYIGNLWDINLIEEITKEVDYILHSAAMRKVKECKYKPLTAFKVNVCSTKILVKAAIKNKVKKIVILSTVRVTNPTTVMSLSKKIMEKQTLKQLKKSQSTKVCIVRLCNLISSKDNIVYKLLQQINNNQPITIYGEKTTRHFMSLEQALALIINCFLYGQNGDIFIGKIKSCSLKFLTQAILVLLEKQNYPVSFAKNKINEEVKELLYSKKEAKYIKDKEEYLIIKQQKQQGLQKLNLNTMVEQEIITMLKDGGLFETFSNYS